MSDTRLDERSKELRRTIVKVLQAAKRGHVGSAYSLIEILRVLYDDVLRYNPQNPKWKDRILAYDPSRIAELATYDDPHQYSVGVSTVLVNGEVVLDGGDHTGALPGRVLKRNGLTSVVDKRQLL